MRSVSGAIKLNSIASHHGFIKQLLFVLMALLIMLPISATAEMQLKGNSVQGGMLIGTGAKGAKVWQDGKSVLVGKDGVFLLGFGRDAAPESQFKIEYANGVVEKRTFKVGTRDYKIQRIDGLPKSKVTPRSEKALKRIRRDGRVVKAARKRNDDRADFLAGFEWPAEGRISGVYGSQRVLNGKPRRPHFGVDIARPTGTPVASPADGIITLAEPDLFFSGGPLVIGHGHKLSSSFLHCENTRPKRTNPSKIRYMSLFFIAFLKRKSIINIAYKDRCSSPAVLKLFKLMWT